MGKRLAVDDEFTIPLGPFDDVFDSPDPKQSRSTRLFDALNMRAADPTNRSAIGAREGMKGSATRLGNSTSRVGKRSFMHRQLDQSLVRYVFMGQKMYEWDGGTTYTDLTPSNVTIDTDGVVFCASYNDFLIVSDEVNKPWVYDAEANTATEIPIDAADTSWCTKGGPVVYDGAIVLLVRTYGADILTDDDDVALTDDDDVVLIDEFQGGVQNTIVWSEPGTPLVGYIQATFNNVWRLTQSSSETLGGIMSEEGALVYWRNVGIGYLTGAIGVDFKTSATKDTISGTVGSNAPASFVYAKEKMWFVDLDGRVYRTRVAAGEPEALHFPVRRNVEANIGSPSNRANVVLYARGAYHFGYNMVLFTIWDRQTVYGFDADSGRYMGQWSINGDLGSGIHIESMDPMVDAQNRTCFVMLGTRTATRDSSTQGVVWRQKQADDTNRWLDQPDESINNHVALTRAIETHWLTSSSAASYRCKEVTAELLADTSRHAVGLQYVTPSGGLSNRFFAQSTATVGEKGPTDSISVARWSPGPNAQGTSIRARLSAIHADNVQWGVSALTMSCVVTQPRGDAK